MEYSDPHYSFEMVYQEYNQKIVHYLSGLVGPNEAEDLTQEVFNKVYRNLNRFRGESSLATWIFQIASNTAKDTFRSPLSRLEAVKIPCADTIEQSGRSIHQSRIPLPLDQRYIQQEMQQCIREFVGKLPLAYREVILLSQFEDFSNQEISKILDISLSNVKIRLHRGRTLLKKAFTSGCEFYYTEQNELACNRKQPNP